MSAIGAVAEQDMFHGVEPGDLVGRGQDVAVGDIIRVAGEAVEGVHMRAQARRDEGGTDGEVLVAAVLAGPGFDRLAHGCAPG
jgi:hypothetical protein